MKNIFPLLLSLVATIFVSGCVQTIPQNTPANPSSVSSFEIQPKTKAYYENFRENCQKSSCCLSSVNNAEQAHSLLYEAESLDTIVCDEGFIPTMNKCEGSYKWCTQN